MKFWINICCNISESFVWHCRARRVSGAARRDDHLSGREQPEGMLPHHAEELQLRLCVERYLPREPLQDGHCLITALPFLGSIAVRRAYAAAILLLLFGSAKTCAAR